MRLNTAQGNAADASQIERLQVSLSTIADHSCPCMPASHSVRARNPRVTCPHASAAKRSHSAA